MDTNKSARIAQARTETQDKVDQALSYSYELQKPAQIEFYVAHLAYLDGLASGSLIAPAKADTANWDVTRDVLEARRSSAAPSPLVFTDPVRYSLPDGRTVSLARDLCRAASTIQYTLKNGTVTTGVICPGQR